MRRIFVVEDEAIVSDDIADTLRHLGYEVAGTAQAGLAALIEIEKTSPDLVLLDITLAGRLDGIQVGAAVRKRLGVPIVYLTAHSDKATMQRAFETEPDGYVSKPFTDLALRTAIEKALAARTT